MKNYRKILKSNYPKLKKIETGKDRKIKQPPITKTKPENTTVKLDRIDENELDNNNFFELVNNRKSRRKFKQTSLTLKKLSYLLWATQGIKKHVRGKSGNEATFRTVPSGGARHPFETYLVVNKVENLKSGIYRYLPMEHELVWLFERENQKAELKDAVLGQEFVAFAPVVFLWSVVPIRSEWRFDIAAHKIMLLDAGHVCQNLYLASESLNCGTCAIGAYDQDKIDNFLDLDGDEEFIVYIAPVGAV